MQYSSLGRTGISASRICFGTMTFGEQTGEDDAHRLLDAAVASGVNFFDAAEMYPIPPKPETQGRTEAYIGSWLTARGNRSEVIVATKIAGPGALARHIRDGSRVFGRAQIREAIDGSLRRLRTDYIDLYQLHWPERPVNAFGRRDYVHTARDFTPFGEVLAALADEITAGRIRAVGVSNETPWGTMAFLSLADGDGLPRIASIQNPYNLLNRLFEVGLAEVAHREDCGLLAYSPLAFGTLTGKYLDGARPPGARLSLFPHYTRYTRRQADAAVRAYVALARDHGLDPGQLAIAWVLSRGFVASAIIGATSEAQLAANIAAADLTLPPAVFDAVDAIHDAHPNPAP